VMPRSKSRLRPEGAVTHSRPLSSDVARRVCTPNYSEPVANEVAGGAGRVVESFAPLSGRVLGYVAVGAGVVLVVGSLLSDPAANRGLVFFGVAVCLVAWVVLIRPLVVAHENGVLLRNMVRDTFVPWVCIERTRVLQTLHVVTPTKVYHGLGVSRSARSVAKESRRGQAPASPGFFGIGGSGIFGRSYPAGAESSTARHAVGVTYQAYVESRLENLAASTAKSAAGTAEVASDRPVTSLAALPLAALGLAACCAALIFV